MCDMQHPPTYDVEAALPNTRIMKSIVTSYRAPGPPTRTRSMSGNSLGISDASLFSPRSSPTASTAGVRTFDDRSIVSNGGQINIPSCSYDRADRNSALSMQVAPSQVHSARGQTKLDFFFKKKASAGSADKSAHADETREAFYQLVKLLRDQRDDLQKCLNRKEEELSAVRTELKNAGKRNEQLQLSYSELEEKCKNYGKHEAAVRRVVRNFTKEFNEIDLLNSQEPEEVSATDEHSESEHPPAKRMRYNFRPANSNERRQSFILSASTRPSSTETFSEALAPRSHISEQPCLPPLAQHISTQPLASTEGLPTFEEYSEMETTLLRSRKIPPYHKFWLSPDLQTYRILYEMLEEEKIEGPVPQFRKWLVENHAQLLLNLDNKHPEIPFPKYIDIAGKPLVCRGRMAYNAICRVHSRNGEGAPHLRCHPLRIAVRDSTVGIIQALVVAWPRICPTCNPPSS